MPQTILGPDSSRVYLQVADITELQYWEENGRWNGAEEIIWTGPPYETEPESSEPESSSPGLPSGDLSPTPQTPIEEDEPQTPDQLYPIVYMSGNYIMGCLVNSTEETFPRTVVFPYNQPNSEGSIGSLSTELDENEVVFTIQTNIQTDTTFVNPIPARVQELSLEIFDVDLQSLIDEITNLPSWTAPFALQYSLIEDLRNTLLQANAVEIDTNGWWDLLLFAYLIINDIEYTVVE